MIKPDFFDIINYSICLAVNKYLGNKTKDFFREVGEYHLNEAIKKGLITIESGDKPLDVLIKIVKYLESTGYMEKISIDKLSEKEASIEMQGVSVAESSARLLKENKHPSHYMTNIMFAALSRFGVKADLKDLKYDLTKARFKESWKIIDGN